MARVAGLLAALSDAAAAATLSVNDVSLVERTVSAATLNFTVTLSSSETVTVSVGFVMSDGTATTGIDYQPWAPYYDSTGTVAFAPGETQKTIGLRVFGDTIREPNETVVVTLSNPVNATIADSQGIATIVDDDHSWSPTGTMVSPRYNHTATLLPDGRVFVAGGWGGTALASPAAELYDPGSGTWRAAAALRYSRYAHTATWLPTGKLLLVGGSYAATRAELYDPLTDSSTETGLLGAGRYDHTATLLQNGKLLVAGGGSTSSPLASAELYNPATGTWTATGALTARTQHSATRLLDGRVLVVGGRNAGGALASAELYDPAQGTWTATAALPGALFGHTATLLADGRVTVVGGTTGGSAGLATAYRYDPGTGLWAALSSLTLQRYSHVAALLPSGHLLVAAGYSSGVNLGDLLDAELFDPVSATWATGGTLAVGRSRGVTATLLADGRVLVCGGIQGAATLASAEVYDSRPLSSASGGALVARRIEHGAALLPNGSVLIAGGLASDNTSLLASAETYDPAAGTWTAAGNLGSARRGPTLTLLPNGKVLAVGGRGATPDVAFSAVELYDPAARTFTAAASLTQPRYGHTATPLADGRVLVVGGTTTNQDILPSAEIYDPTTGLWTFIASVEAFPSHTRTQHTATLLHNGKVLVAGGCGTGTGASARLYDPLSAAWTSTGVLPTGYCQHASVLLRDGRVLVAGGFDGGGRTSATLYDPASGTWAETGSLTYARVFHTATLLVDGRVLVIGNADVPTSEVYDPTAGAWTETGLTSARLNSHSATLLPDGRVLVAGGSAPSVGFAANAEVITCGNELASRRPVITSTSGTLTSGGAPFTVTGTGFGSDSEASAGRTSHSSTAHPLLEVRSIANGRVAWLDYDALTTFAGNPTTLSVSRVRPALDSGWYMASVVTNGVRSFAKVVTGSCGMQIVQQPQPAIAAIGATATFSVVADGATEYQWRRDGVDIPGARGSSYTTPAIVAADAGSLFSVRVRGLCSTQTSGDATLTVQDSTPPTAGVVSPAGGEYWLLSESGSPASTQVVTWTMSDDVRVCHVDVELRYSDDGGTTYFTAAAGGGLPASFGPGGVCAYPGEGATSLLYTIPASPPSGSAGSLYKVRVTVTDQAGNASVAQSANPFYIVQPNPDAVRTLILANLPRMASLGMTTTGLGGKLQELASNPRVQGWVVDLGGVSSVAALYAAWDADAGNADLANAVLFASGGIHDYLRTQLLPAYTGVTQLVIVGDDRVIPFARMADRTTLLPETTYPDGTNLTSTGTTVGQALAGGSFLSDDPLAVLDAVTPADLSGVLYIPDLAVGRLVETPAEIISTIATFISQNGTLNLSALDPGTGHKVLVTGYDFLTDSAKQVRGKWKQALGVSTPDDSTAPVDGSLISGSWSLGDPGLRVDALEARLCGSYAVSSLSGHATHYEEGVPGTDPFDIQGLGTDRIVSPDTCGPIDLAGGVAYAVGCHGGLPVSDDGVLGDNVLDLPQAMLGRGLMAYVANTGYGWGLKSGIGYSERLQEIFTEELAKGGTVVVGDAVRRAKQRYFLETPRYDVYDEKSLMEWTLFGLPMYALKTGIAASRSGADAGRFEGPAPRAAEIAGAEAYGSLLVERELRNTWTSQRDAEAAASAIPAYLTQLSLHFDFSAPGVYTKRDAAGDDRTAEGGCPALLLDGSTANEGCYYTLNGLVERSSGAGDLPIQPYFIYDSRLSGTSQHGVLWRGGVYREESGWTPIVAELQSNAAYTVDHGAAPRTTKMRSIGPRVVPGQDPAECRPSDLELNSLVVDAGEAVKAEDTDPSFTIERTYREIDLEVFYYNNTSDSLENCDREGPALGTGPFAGNAYHQVTTGGIEFAVPATDAAGVWRVVVVVTDNTVGGSGHGIWAPVELQDDGSGTWRGAQTILSPRATYVVQAVDKRGNVTWLDYVTAQPPSSGIEPGIPETVDVPVVPPALPGVSSVQPPSGPVGTTVVITGTAFLGATQVAFGGVPAVFTIELPTRITATVPAGAVTGPVSVTTGAGTGTSLSKFTVIPPLKLSVTDVRVREGNGGARSAVFRVWLNATSKTPVTVTYETLDGTATGGAVSAPGFDYVSKPQTPLTFAPYARSRTVSVAIVPDADPEGAESFKLKLSSAVGAAIARAEGTATILDDDH